MKDFLKTTNKILEIVVESYLFSALIALAGAIVIAFLVPDYLKISEKIGKTLYFTLALIVLFLIAESIKALGKFLFKKYSNNKFEKKEIKENNDRVLEDLWSFVDGLSLQDRELLIDFLKSNNEPIEIRGCIVGNTILNNPKLVVSTVCDTNVKVNIGNVECLDDKEVIGIAHFPMNSSFQKKEYKLSPDFYKLLKYSYENENRISHFHIEVKNNE